MIFHRPHLQKRRRSLSGKWVDWKKMLHFSTFATDKSKWLHLFETFPDDILRWLQLFQTFVGYKSRWFWQKKRLFSRGKSKWLHLLRLLQAINRDDCSYLFSNTLLRIATPGLRRYPVENQRKWYYCYMKIFWNKKYKTLPIAR